ncbi:MAG: hypothetical protein AB1921_08835 [Thermodesulfobacteriota bacterium]
MAAGMPEKARLLARLRDGRFNVPELIYVPAEDFEKENFGALRDFLSRHQESFKVIARSAHPMEEFFKGGTFDSLETYADLAGIQYARKRIVTLAKTAKSLSILRQQMFSDAPRVDLDDMGIIIMPFITGMSVMAKQLGENWEFGYCCDTRQKIQVDPYVTNTPHDIRLLAMSEEIQKYLGFRCEIEFIAAETGEIYVVQAKDISRFDTRELTRVTHSIKLDGIRRIRVQKNYRERPVFVMDNKSFYIKLIGRCEDFVLGTEGKPKPSIEEILSIIEDYEKEMEEFAVLHERYAVLGLSIREPKELYQVANHYLEDFPPIQEKLSKALSANLYKMDYFLAEADTLVAKDRFRINLCSHDAYGIDTLRNPLWSVYWNVERHDAVVKAFRRMGIKTGDSVGIDIGQESKPTLYLL